MNAHVCYDLHPCGSQVSAPTAAAAGAEKDEKTQHALEKR